MSEALFEEHGLLAGSTRDGGGHALIDNSRFVVLMGLAVDVMLFSGLIGGYFVLRGGLPSPQAPDLSTLNRGLALASSLSIGLGCLFLWLTVRAQTRNELLRMRLALASAFVFFTVFIGLNIVEWSSLMSDGLRIRSVLGGIYFVITGIFHLHVLAGMVYISLKLRQTLRWHRYTRSNNSVTHLTYYFYTMLAVWLAIFGVIYL